MRISCADSSPRMGRGRTSRACSNRRRKAAPFKGFVAMGTPRRARRSAATSSVACRRHRNGAFHGFDVDTPPLCESPSLTFSCAAHRSLRRSSSWPRCPTSASTSPPAQALMARDAYGTRSTSNASSAASTSWRHRSSRATSWPCRRRSKPTLSPRTSTRSSASAATSRTTTIRRTAFCRTCSVGRWASPSRSPSSTARSRSGSACGREA